MTDEAPVSDQLDALGRARCPICLATVRGEAHTFVNYWHPVEVCRDALVLRVRDLERRLAERDMRRL
jgi:hypothetical protein